MSKLRENGNFIISMNCIEAAAWNLFVIGVNEFLSNKRTVNYGEIIGNMLENFQNLGAKYQA